MSHTFAVLLSSGVEVLGYLLVYLVSTLVPALVLLAVGTLPLALSIRILLRSRPCNCC